MKIKKGRGLVRETLLKCCRVLGEGAGRDTLVEFFNVDRKFGWFSREAL